MNQLLIVEDNPDHAEILRRLVEGHPRASELCVEHALDEVKLRAFLAERSVDILVIDIDLGPDNLNGIELVQRLFPVGSGTQVVYVTGYVDFCTSVYRTEHVYFLAKPVNQDDFNDALDKALNKLEKLEASSLVVRSAGSVKMVRPSAIRYIESNRRKVCIHAEGNVLVTYATLADLVEQLPDSFIQCHKSFLVNLDHVAELDKDNLTLYSDETIPVSQKRRKATREALFRHLRRNCDRG